MNVVINLNKPPHVSSQQAVAKVKRFLGVRKAGHAGTLDPLATGVLIICLNEATKIARFLPDLEKEYIFRLKLGEKTDTLDSTGVIVEKKDPGTVREDDVRKVLSGFLGYIHQIPPMFSALKKGGVPLYKLARKGVTVERAERTVQIRQLELLSFEPPYIDLRTVCSKGTYIRSLCDDIGHQLGAGAHLTMLTRTRVGHFTIQDALSLEHLTNGREGFSSMDEALRHFREIVLDDNSTRKLISGLPVCIFSSSPSTGHERLNGCTREASSGTREYVRMKNSANILFGIGILEKNVLRPERLFRPPDNRPL